MRSQRATKATNMEIAGRQKNLNAFLLNSEKSFQDMAFSDKDPGCDPKGYSKARKGKCLSNRKAPATFY